MVYPAHIEAYLRENGWFPYSEHPEKGSEIFDNMVLYDTDWFHYDDMGKPWYDNQGLMEQLKRDGLLY